MAWLFLLRELPDSLFRWQGSTDLSGYIIRDLTETLTSGAPERDPGVEMRHGSGAVVFTPDEQGMSCVLRLVAISVLLKQVHVWLRMAAKGVPFATGEDFPPSPLPSEGQARAISAYDRRLQGGVASGLLNTAFVIADESSLFEDPGEFDVVETGRLLPSEDVVFPDTAPKAVRVAFMPRAQSLKPLAEFNQHPSFTAGWYGAYAPALAAGLRLGLRLLQANFAAIDPIHEKGTLHFPDYPALLSFADRRYADAVRLARSVFPDAALPPTANELFTSLQTLPVRPWPPTPPSVLRSAGAAVALDLRAMTLWFDRQLRIPLTGGAFDNARGTRFEDQVQAVVDASDWGRVPETIRALQGRTLKRSDGSSITNIDAIGALGSTVLLIDCLSRVADQDLETTGDPDAYRRAAARVEEKVSGTADGTEAGWVTKVGNLAGTSGRNYDLRAYDKVLPVVVTPTVVYLESQLAHRTPLMAAAEVVAGLHYVATYDELRDWLLDGSSTGDDANRSSGTP